MCRRRMRAPAPTSGPARSSPGRAPPCELRTLLQAGYWTTLVFVGRRAMHPAMTGALVGLGIGVAMFVVDYSVLRGRAAERAKKAHKTVVEFDPTDKTRISALLRFA